MVDYRNKDKISNFASRRKLQELEAAAAQGRVVVVDALGRMLRVGDLISVQALPQATVFRLLEATPVLTHPDPRMLGMITAKFAAEIVMTIPSGHPQGGLLLVDPIEAQVEAARDAGEITDAQAAAATDAAAAPPPALSPIVLTDGQH